MGLIKLKGFNKKKTKTEEEKDEFIEEVTKVDGKKLTMNQVKVVIFHKLSEDTAVTHDSFICNREKDRTSGVTRITNKEKNFDVLEPMTDNTVEVEMSDNEIKKRIDKIEELLNVKKGKPNAKINERDLIVEQNKLKINLRRNKYKTKDKGFGSYYYLSKDGSRSLMFLEDKDEFIPFRINLDSYTIHTDCGSKKKPASVAMSNTLKKFESKISKALEGRLAWFFTVLVVFLIVNVVASGFLISKYKEYDEMFETSSFVTSQAMAANTTYSCLNKLQELQATGFVTYSDQQIEDIKYKQSRASNGAD